MTAMDPRIQKLVAAFEATGWTNKGPVDMSDWWFSDIVQLSSTWRPVNTSLYLTLLTDPQILDKKFVWAVGISSNIPHDTGKNFIATVTLNDISKISLQDLVKKINETVLH